MRDVRIRGPIVLSLQALVDHSRAGLLFASSPQANTWLPLLVEALPDASPLIVDSGAIPLLRDEANLTLQSAGREAAFSLINKAVSFGPVSARQRLLDEIATDGGDPAPPGASASASTKRDTQHRNLDARPNQKPMSALPALITRSQNEFLSRPALLTDCQDARNHLIEVLDAANLEALFEKNIAAIAQLIPNVSEREAVLDAGLPDDLLIRLPIHERQDGTVEDGKGIFRETKEWSVPEPLRVSFLSSGRAKARRLGNGKDSLLGHGHRKARLRLR